MMEVLKIAIVISGALLDQSSVMMKRKRLYCFDFLTLIHLVNSEVLLVIEAIILEDYLVANNNRYSRYLIRQKESQA